MNTEIRTRYVTGCSAYSENGWWAELVEDGEVVWPEARAFSAISPEHAVDRMLMKLDGVIAL